jgi:4-carboxymuconolactone decarboxylase
MKVLLIGFVLFISGTQLSFAQQAESAEKVLSVKEQSIIYIAALTAKGNLTKLKTALNTGLEAGLTINEIKEVLVHLYAYCGFPRSIRGLQTFMEVLDDRKAKNIHDKTGNTVSPVDINSSRYDRGKNILATLTQSPQPDIFTGYAAFAPVIDSFLKEHLFADIFERDVLTYAERELVTISVISAIGNAAPMLRSHLNICLNVGITTNQLQQFVRIIKSTVGKKKANAAKMTIAEVLKNKK